MRGRLMFHPAQPDREYSLGYNHDCDFLVPHGLGILPGAWHFPALRSATPGPRHPAGYVLHP